MTFMALRYSTEYFRQDEIRLPLQPDDDDDSPESYDKYAAYVISNACILFFRTFSSEFDHRIFDEKWLKMNKCEYSLVSVPCADVKMRFLRDWHEQPFMVPSTKTEN